MGPGRCRSVSVGAGRCRSEPGGWAVPAARLARKVGRNVGEAGARPCDGNRMSCSITAGRTAVAGTYDSRVPRHVLVP